MLKLSKKPRKSLRAIGDFILKMSVAALMITKFLCRPHGLSISALKTLC